MEKRDFKDSLETEVPGRTGLREKKGRGWFFTDVIKIRISR